jgi:hypothetical protein
MLLKRLTSILLVLVVLFVFIMPAGITKGDDGQGFGVVTINGVEMYKSKSGETYPIVIFDGKKCIKWHEFDIVSVEDVINCESGKSDMMLKNFINKYQKNHDNGNQSKFYVNFSTGDKAGYNQTYSSWANTRLGFSEWDSQKNWWKYTIGNAGCFLCSTASELLRYGLKYTDYGSNANPDPLNINTWLKDHGGFTGASLNFSAVANFPGISYVNNGFDDFYGAAMILYQCPPNAPIICLQKQGYPVGEGYHFCLYVSGNGNNPYYWDQTYGWWTTNQTLANNHQVIDPGFNGSSDPRGTVRNLWDVYWEGSPHYVRPGSGIFRVAFKE